MKPVREFVYARIRLYTKDRAELIHILRNTGYYEYDFKGGITISEYYELLPKYNRWCNDNYPDDYSIISGIFFFTNKDIATLMKLSVL